ncbi:MAG: hypothetical protein FJX35_09850 [Alphaproteobacteria bacterium]|nr:hypothetical protein [Alphaproteobacteria bacterium]
MIPSDAPTATDSEASDYDKTWSQLGELLTAIERSLLPGSQPSDARFLTLLRLFQRYRYFVKPFIGKYGTPVKWDRFFKIVEAKADARNFDQELLVNGETIRVSIQEKELIYRDLVSSAVLAGAGGSADCFVELGSGWSSNIFNLWRNGAPGGAIYVGAEPTTEGRALAERFARHQATRDFRSVAFDYAGAAFDWLPRGIRRLVVFSVYSIEQMEHLDPGFFDRLIAATAGIPEVVGVHIEPVAWQYALSGVDAPTPDWAVEARKQALWRDHNVNMMQVLDDAEARGLLNVQAVTCRSMAAAPEHPGATIRWTRR